MQNDDHSNFTKLIWLALAGMTAFGGWCALEDARREKRKREMNKERM